MHKSLGSKRKELAPELIWEIARAFSNFMEVDDRGVEKDGKEKERVMLYEGIPTHQVPAGNRVKVVPFAKILANHEFGYRTITIERLPRTSRAMSCLEPRGKQKGKPQADIKLHDTENVPMGGDVQTYLQCEVLPHGLDAWIDETKRDKKSTDKSAPSATISPPTGISTSTSCRARWMKSAQVFLADIQGMIREMSA